MASSANEAPQCWVISDGRAGIENQALGLAEAVARITPLTIEIKRINIRRFWKHLPRALWGNPFSKLSPAGDALSPPFPPLWIASGRLSVPLTIAVKKIHPATMTIQTQHPHTDITQFDLVIPPLHDNLSGANVFPILGAPHRITRERLDNEARRAGLDIGGLGRPRVAVLIGGPNSEYAFSAAPTDEFLRDLKKLSDDGAGLMITTSRRTPAGLAERIANALSGARYLLFDAGRPEDQPNPYFAILAAADHILVTADSVNMAAEAAATGKPVQIIPLEKIRRVGDRPSKFEAFHDGLIERGNARKFKGALEQWDVSLLAETERAAAEIVKRWRDRNFAAGRVT